MLPDRVSNPGPLTYESVALLIALHGPATPEGEECQGYTEQPFSYVKSWPFTNHKAVGPISH